MIFSQINDENSFAELAPMIHKYSSSVDYNQDFINPENQISEIQFPL